MVWLSTLKLVTYHVVEDKAYLTCVTSVFNVWSPLKRSEWREYLSVPFAHITKKNEATQAILHWGLARKEWKLNWFSILQSVEEWAKWLNNDFHHKFTTNSLPVLLFSLHWLVRHIFLPMSAVFLFVQFYILRKACHCLSSRAQPKKFHLYEMKNSSACLMKYGTFPVILETMLLKR